MLETVVHNACKIFRKPGRVGREDFSAIRSEWRGWKTSSRVRLANFLTVVKYPLKYIRYTDSKKEHSEIAFKNQQILFKQCRKNNRAIEYEEENKIVYKSLD
uniref:Uncharacterized protein n=1 Tax=Schistocephalus solidus TaxID=70667 RepID=A0A0X3PI48_SCHSO